MYETHLRETGLSTLCTITITINKKRIQIFKIYLSKQTR